MNSVERVVEYSSSSIGETEKPAFIPSRRPPADWPSQGAIELRGLCIRYRPGLPDVLKSLTLSVRGQEKVRPAQCPCCWPVVTACVHFQHAGTCRVAQPLRIELGFLCAGCRPSSVSPFSWPALSPSTATHTGCSNSMRGS